MSEPEARQAFLDWVERDGAAAVAEACGLSKPMISLIGHGRRSLSKPVCAAMGLRRVVSFEPIA
ncbi:MAG TPA: hypothetical protein VF637_08755 [Sphingomicrobium sp.]|jgi:hypothetical protein